MPKKQKRYYDQFDDDEFEDDEFFDEDDPLVGESDALESGWLEQDILGLCGGANASKGLALYQQQRVTDRGFDGAALRASVRDDAGTWHPEFDTQTDGGKCLCPAERRARSFHCEHIAALLYACVYEPASFGAPTLGSAFAALQNNPALRAQLGIPEAQFENATQLLAGAPPELRAALNRLAFNPSSQDVETIQTELQRAQAALKQTQLLKLLEGLSEDQLRAIAARRGWTIPQNKPEMVAQLARQLRDAPQPETFSSEEELLLRFENTLYALQDSPTPEDFVELWKQRGGGDMARLDRAKRGLASAGVLFECRREQARLHYHWSPLLDANTLPLLRPHVTRLEPHALARLRRVELAADSSPAFLLDQLNALVEYVARTPLALQRPERDPAVTASPFIGQWNYDPTEVKLQKTGRGGSMSLPESLSVPMLYPLSHDALDRIAMQLGFAGEERETREHALWLLGMLRLAGLLEESAQGNLAINSQRVEQWQLLTLGAQFRMLWDTWLRGGTFEFQHLQDNAGLALQRTTFAQQFTPQALQARVGDARQFIARLLEKIEPQTWHTFDSFAQYIHQLQPTFLHGKSGDRFFWLASRDNFRYSAHNAKHWDTAYRAFLAALFGTGLAWLGVVENVYKDDTLAAFQITPLGAWLLRNESVETFPAQPASALASDEPILTWLDAETVRLRGGTDSAALLAAVRAIAEPTGARLTFRLSNEALARAIERGMTADALAQPFADAGAPLPDAARARLAATYANYGRLHLYERLTVLELADDFALRELLAGTSLRQHILHQFSPRVVVMRDDAVESFVQELEKKGYTPRVV